MRISDWSSDVCSSDLLASSKVRSNRHNYELDKGVGDRNGDNRADKCPRNRRSRIAGLAGRDKAKCEPDKGVHSDENGLPTRPGTLDGRACHTCQSNVRKDDTKTQDQKQGRTTGRER